MENMDKKTLTNLAISAVLVIIALVSALWLADVFSAPEHHSASIAALDEKKTTVMEMTAATATVSVAISAVPGDATTPIADQVAELSSYLLIVTGVLMLEKFLLLMTFRAAFAWLIPIACVLGIVYLLVPKPLFKGLAIRLAALGAALCMVIPVSLKVSDLFENTFELQKTVAAAAQSGEELEEEATEEEENAEGESEQGGIAGWFAGLGDQITGGVSDAVDAAEAKLSEFIDAVAVLIVSNCVIPVLVLVLMLWLLKAFVSLPLDGGPRPLALPPHKHRETD